MVLKKSKNLQKLTQWSSSTGNDPLRSTDTLACFVGRFLRSTPNNQGGHTKVVGRVGHDWERFIPKKTL